MSENVYSRPVWHLNNDNRGHRLNYGRLVLFCFVTLLTSVQQLSTIEDFCSVRVCL